MSMQECLSRCLSRGVVGFPVALASAVGVVMASPVILTATSGFGMAGGTFALALLIAYLMMLAQATTFAEAAAMLPTSGAVYDYISAGLGRGLAIAGTLSAYLLVHVFAGTAETILSGIMALVNFDHLNTMLEKSGSAWTVGVGLVIAFGALNALGVTVFGKAEVVLTFGMWATLTTFGVAGLLRAPAVDLGGWFGAPLQWGDPGLLLSLVGMAMFMFVGAELVTPLAPELRDSGRAIPRALKLGLSGVAVAMLLFGAAMTRQVANLPLDPAQPAGPRLLDTPMALPAFAERVMGPFGKIWLGIGLLLAGAATINTLMAALPRILYGMAQDGALPRCFAYLHPRFKTPWCGIGLAVLIPCVHAWLIRGDLERIMPLVLAAVCSWGVAYLLVTLSIVRLRLTRPDFPRAYRSPWFPLPQIGSALGIVLAICFITPPGMQARDIYAPFGLMLGLTLLYALLWTVLVQKVNPFRPVPLEQILRAELSEPEDEALRRELERVAAAG
ncbi:APC family permease [Chromobacterium aquaticum]|uniref:APC family permease n=1 Tax=Chromobacterium aquaticum TaxID=467180 RepID=A0ABV8ZRP2_9NEIS|nr:APC family permease [Chromobacterium aquaticum]MCD5363191.1 APC family permease [Chromobacterium aquaticum]